METINNVRPLSSEKLFDLLKKEFAEYINEKLGSNISVDYARVFDVINVIFPEVAGGFSLTVTITDPELIITANASSTAYDTDLLQEHLVRFLELHAG